MTSGGKLRGESAFVRVALIGATLIASCLGGCAISYDDSVGNHHVVGLLDQTTAPARDGKTLAGNVVAISTVGVLVSRNAQGTTFALGYASETTAAIKDNALVLGNPVQAAQTIFEGEKQ